MAAEWLARLSALRGNKWAMAGLAGAAGLGGYALIRRRGASAGAGSAPGATDGASTTGAASGPIGVGTSFPNTYATDLASAVGDLDSRYASDLESFTSQLGTSYDALAAMQAKTNTQVASVTKSVAALKASKAPAKVSPKPKAKKPTSSTAKVGWQSITIRRGDTLGALAARYHTTVGALVKANAITDPNRISAGARLKVPT